MTTFSSKETAELALRPVIYLMPGSVNPDDAHVTCSWGNLPLQFHRTDVPATTHDTGQNGDSRTRIYKCSYTIPWSTYDTINDFPSSMK